MEFLDLVCPVRVFFRQDGKVFWLIEVNFPRRDRISAPVGYNGVQYFADETAILGCYDF